MNERTAFQQPVLPLPMNPTVPVSAKIICDTALNDNGYRLIGGMGFSPMDAPSLFRSVELACGSGFHKGIAVRNDNGGTEVYSPGVSRRFFTLGEPGVLTVRVFRHSRTTGCCLFASLFDYLAYLSFGTSSGMQLPRGCDAIVMNDYRNFASMVVDSDVYSSVHCLFPQDEAGLVMESTLLFRNRRAHTSARNYRGYVSLYDKYRSVVLGLTDKKS